MDRSAGYMRTICGVTACSFVLWPDGEGEGQMDCIIGEQFTDA